MEGAKNFLLKHQLLTGGHSYRVLDDQQRPRFTVQESFGQGLGASLLGGAVGSVFAHRTLGWTVLDAAGNEQAAITLVVSGYHAVSTLADVSGAPVLVVTVDRGFMGGLTATAAGPDGRPMFQARGNLINQSFSILDPGGQEVARIHKALISVADTYNLDLVANVDPVGPLVFAILIDREKERR